MHIFEQQMSTCSQTLSHRSTSLQTFVDSHFLVVIFFSFTFVFFLSAVTLYFVKNAKNPKQNRDIFMLKYRRKTRRSTRFDHSNHLLFLHQMNRINENATIRSNAFLIAETTPSCARVFLECIDAIVVEPVKFFVGLFNRPNPIIDVCFLKRRRRQSQINSNRIVSNCRRRPS